jgi:hypothetical protein
MLFSLCVHNNIGWLRPVCLVLGSSPDWTRPVYNACKMQYPAIKHDADQSHSMSHANSISTTFMAHLTRRYSTLHVLLSQVQICYSEISSTLTIVGDNGALHSCNWVHFDSPLAYVLIWDACADIGS